VQKPLTLGERIAQARREKGVRERRDVSQSEIAEAIGVTTANHSRWESGQRVPREDALGKLAAYLGVTPAYLRYGVETTTPPIPEGVTLQGSNQKEVAKQAAKDRAALSRRRKRRASGDR
jgi:transcriptional regulator with XRE-family HTH domain